MLLEDIGPATSTPLGGRSTHARSHLGEIVIVQATESAITAYDLTLIWPVAESMYLAGFFELIGGTKIIYVASDDCRKWLDNQA